MNQKLKEQLQNKLQEFYHSIEKQEPAYAVALILSTSEEILLIERAKREGDHWSGQMAFPGGRSETMDLNMMTTAIREAKEEVAVVLSPKDCLGGLLDMQLRKRGLPTEGTLFSFVFVVNKQDLKIADDEVQSVHWVPLSFFKDPQNMDEYILEREGKRIGLPCLNYNGKKIWGLTYHLLSHFFASYGCVSGENYEHIVPLYI